MRQALISTAALGAHLSTLAGSEQALDLRGDAYGLGAAQVAPIARDAGFRYARYSPGRGHSIALAPAPDEMPLVSEWFLSDQHTIVTCRAEVVALKHVPAGTTVSYGYEYATGEETTLALISAGFADGVPRTGSPGARIRVGDTTYPIAGRIAMDQCVIDAPGLECAVGEPAIIWGDDPTVSQWALWSARPEGALLSHLSPRVVRTWI